MISIGFDAKRAFYNTSGLGNYSRFVLSALLRHFPENRYLLFTPGRPGLFRHFDPALNLAQVVEPTGMLQKLPALWRTFGMASSVQRHKVDVFHGLSNELPYRIHRTGTRSVVTIHDLIFFRYPELYKPLDRAIYRQKFRAACQVADKIIAISDQTKQDLMDFLGTAPDKIEVIYQDCASLFHRKQERTALEAIRAKYRLPDRFLLSVGTLEERKNQLSLLRAWHASGCWQELSVVFVGRQTAYTRHLKHFAETHQLSERVHFMPYIPATELPAFYQLASLFAYLSLFEGFGIPILEALNSGVPVITSTGSCFGEAGGDAALYVPPQGGEEALATAIRKVSEDSNLRAQMTERGYAHALRFRPERTIPQLMHLYQSLL